MTLLLDTHVFLWFWGCGDCQRVTAHPKVRRGSAVLHCYYVGHFDPCDCLDLSAKPYKPKCQRPLSREAIERVLARFDRGVADYVWYDEGSYVGCDWSRAPWPMWEEIRRFALSLAEAENVVVMNEDFRIEYPETARTAQEEYWANWQKVRVSTECEDM